jgi:hypothetical protein
MPMFVTLVAVLCHTLAHISAPACVEEIVTDSNFTAIAGKADAPISMPSMTFTQCQVEGQIVVSKWMAEHPKYKSGWQLNRWKCVPGHYEIGKPV